MKKKTIRNLILIIGALLVYTLLLWLLVLVEAGDASASITDLPTAFWYSVTTLTTVGYGDTYPVTGVGRVIGFIFQLMSLGVLVAVISFLAQLLKERVLPLLRLRFARNASWYWFSGGSEKETALARRIRQDDPSAVLLFPMEAKSEVPASLNALCCEPRPEELALIKKDLSDLHVFFLGDDSFDNEKKTAALRGTKCRVYCLSEREPEIISEQEVYFHPCEGTARLYWHRYPLASMLERIVLVGGGRFGRAMLEQGLAFNVISPGQSIRYWLCGDWSEFAREHPQLSSFVSLEREERGKDAVFFVPGAWNNNWQIFREADRIIFCGDDEEETAEQLEILKRCCPVKGTVYARLSQAVDGVICFGGTADLFVPELIMQRSLNRLAIDLHESYRAKTEGNKLPAWNELGRFLRHSNLSSADHLFMKARILLGHETETFPDRWQQAAEKFRNLSESEREHCREIEHERWSRFHYLNNWEYGPVRDNARRIHPLLCPYDALSPEERAKDDYSWELLARAAEHSGER